RALDRGGLARAHVARVYQHQRPERVGGLAGAGVGGGERVASGGGGVGHGCSAPSLRIAPSTISPSPITLASPTPRPSPPTARPPHAPTAPSASRPPAPRPP